MPIRNQNANWDAIVLGLGGMGSAAACHLAARGCRVLGLEQFTSPHDRGSSHGETRVIRQAYYEDPAYVPLLLRAYELWKALEQATRRRFLTLCGGLMIGSPDSAVVAGSRQSAVAHGLAHDLLDADEIQQRFPALRPPRGAVGLFEKNAGFLRVEKSVQAHLDRARDLGAKLQFEETVLRWEATSSGVRVNSSRGLYEAGKLIITAGLWAARMLFDLSMPLEVERQVLFWFAPIGGIEQFLPNRFPIFIFEAASGLLPYGFPALNSRAQGVKVALYRTPYASICTPESIDRQIQQKEINRMQEIMVPLIPALAGNFLRGVTCMYTNTPDRNFILDTHPDHPQVSIAAGFSGHGFKFCSVIGEILADLAERGRTSHDLAPFRLERFGNLL